MVSTGRCARAVPCAVRSQQLHDHARALRARSRDDDALSGWHGLDPGSRSPIRQPDRGQHQRTELVDRAVGQQRGDQFALGQPVQYRRRHNCRPRYPLRARLGKGRRKRHSSVRRSRCQGDHPVLADSRTSVHSLAMSWPSLSRGSVANAASRKMTLASRVSARLSGSMLLEPTVDPSSSTTATSRGMVVCSIRGSRRRLAADTDAEQPGTGVETAQTYARGGQRTAWG